MTNPLRTVPTRLAGLVLVEPRVNHDERGFFLETFRNDAYRAIGIEVDFVQDNHSRSSAGTLRGLHFQIDPGQPKLIRVARGEIFDVVVDIRRTSPTFGQWESFFLDDHAHRQLFVPRGFAHGFCALSETVDLVYKVGSYYASATERGIAWNDPALGIEWPIQDPFLSERDRALPTLAEVAASLPDW